MITIAIRLFFNKQFSEMIPNPWSLLFLLWSPDFGGRTSSCWDPVPVSAPSAPVASYMRFCLPLACIHIGNGIWRSSISRWRHSLQEAIWYFHQFRFNMCAAANLGYGLHVKSIDRNYILVKNYISLINVIYIQLKKHVKFACCLVDNEIPSFMIQSQRDSQTQQ